MYVDAAKSANRHAIFLHAVCKRLRSHFSAGGGPETTRSALYLVQIDQDLVSRVPIHAMPLDASTP